MSQMSTLAPIRPAKDFIWRLRTAILFFVACLPTAFFPLSIQGAPGLAANVFVLATNEFRDLTPGETEFFRMVAAGERANFLARSDADNDPSGAARWDLQKRVIDAKYVRWLCTNSQAWPLVPARGISVAGARIKNQLDLTYVKVPFPLYFEKCSFPDGIDLQSAETHDIHLIGTHTGPIAADALKVTGDLFMRQGFHSEGDIRLTIATVSGQVSFSQATLNGKSNAALSATGIQIGRGLFMRGTTNHGVVNFKDARITGTVHCEGGSFINTNGTALDFEGLRVDGNLQFVGARTQGELRLKGAHIGGGLDFSDAVLSNGTTNTINAERLQLDGGDFLLHKTTNHGGIYLYHATIHGDLHCDESRLVNHGKNAIDAWYLKVLGNVLLHDGTFVDGTLDFFDTEIGGWLELQNCILTNRPDLAVLKGNSIKVNRGALLSGGFQPFGLVDLESAWINEDFYFQCEHPAKTSLNLAFAHVGILRFQKSGWPKTGNLMVNGFFYDHVADRETTTPKDRADWIRLQNKTNFSLQPYEQMATVLGKAGKQDDANLLRIEMENDRTPLMKWPERPLHSAFGWVAGYGYRPWLPIWIEVGLVIAGGFAFNLGFRYKLMDASRPDAYVAEGLQKAKLVRSYPRFNGWVYSLDVLLPPLNLHQSDYWAPISARGTTEAERKRLKLRPGDCMRWYLIAHKIFGWGIVTIFAGMKTGLF